MQKLTDVERSLETTEEECMRLKDLCTSVTKELNMLAAEHGTCSKRVQELTDKLENALVRGVHFLALGGSQIFKVFALEMLKCSRIPCTRLAS